VAIEGGRYGDAWDTPLTPDGSQVPPGYYRDPVTGQILPVQTQTPSVRPDTPAGPADAYQGFASTWAPGASAPSNAPAGAHWDPTSAMYLADSAPITGTGGGGGGGGGGAGGGGVGGGGTGLFTPPPERFDTSGWSASLPTLQGPSYQPPAAYASRPFVEPDYAASLQDPAYLFEASEGRRAMEQGAAARGVLNGGGTLKDINAWGQNFATQRVNDVRNRARDTWMVNDQANRNTYQMNYQTQFTDPYKYAYQSALDAYTGQLSGWQTKAQVGQRQNEVDWQHAYTPYNDNWNRAIQIGLA
jgi:hypothetical protein